MPAGLVGKQIVILRGLYFPTWKILESPNTQPLKLKIDRQQLRRKYIQQMINRF